MSDRIPIIAGNWKMNLTEDDAISLAGSLIDRYTVFDKAKIIIFPPYIYLKEIIALVKGSVLRVGAQNMHFEDGGAYTGEISAPMLKSIDCNYVIIGHSERRRYFGESDRLVNSKLKAAFKHRLSPIMCIGETLQQREDKQTFDVLEQQIKVGLDGVKLSHANELIIAYEPVWAIGTGRTATPRIAQEAHQFIRELLSSLYGNQVSDAMIIQYGGSVKPDNIAQLMAQPDIDGALVGGASLKYGDFVKIIEYERS